MDQPLRYKSAAENDKLYQGSGPGQAKILKSTYLPTR